MNAAVDRGIWLSGLGHLGLILWVILGDWLFAARDVPEIAVAEVSLISAEDFAALEAAAANPPAPAPEPQPEPQPQPEPAPAPEPPPTPEPTPQPEASVPAPVETPDTNPVVEPVLPSTAPILPEAKPQPKPSDVVAPNPTDAPDAPSEPSPDAAPDVTEAPTPVPVEPPPPEAPAPADTGDVVETEENKDNIVAALAPRESGRPRSRPEKPPTLGANEPAPEAEGPSETPPEAEAPNESDALAAALAEAQAETDPALPTGPPMTGSEKEALRVAVSSCWNVGSLSTAALQTEVVVGVSLTQNGTPDAASVRLLTFSGGSEAGAQQAFEAARRAIIRCGARGFPLPPEKYSQWKELELVFDPSGMRMR